MTDDQQPPTAPGFSSLPIAPASEGRLPASAPVRGAWSLRRRAATAVAALALVGTGGAVGLSATGSLTGADEGSGAAPAAPAQPGSATSGHDRDGDETAEHTGDQPGDQSGDHEDSDEA